MSKWKYYKNEVKENFGKKKISKPKKYSLRRNK